MEINGDRSLNKVFVTLVIGNDEFSYMVREVVEYVIDIVREKYGLNIIYRRVFGDSPYPYMIINDMKPLVIDKIPSISDLMNLVLMIADTNSIVMSKRDELWSTVS